MYAKRKGMGEEAWEEHQKTRRYKKSLTYKKKNALAVITHRRNKKKKLIEYKGGECEDCGYKSPYQSAYCFHHIDPKEKEINIASNMQLKMDTLLKEVDKCQLLCVRCHSELHDKEYEISVNERIEEYKSMTKEDIDQKSKNRKKKLEMVRCDGCPEEFKKSKSFQRYCSRECYQRNAQEEAKKRIKPKNKCQKCETDISRESNHCKKCSSIINAKKREKVNWENVNLHKLLLEDKKSLTSIGKDLGVSDNAVRKRAKKLGIIK